MKTKAVLLLLSLFLLSGCAQDESNVYFPLVREITVEYENGPIHGQLCYNEDEKMQQILNYLRLLDPYGQPPEDPQTAQGPLFRIRMRLAGGDTTLYQQKADRYLKVGSAAWLCIPPQKALELSLLLGYLETDIAQPIVPQFAP